MTAVCANCGEALIPLHRPDPCPRDNHDPWAFDDGVDNRHTHQPIGVASATPGVTLIQIMVPIFPYASVQSPRRRLAFRRRR